jgi:hypothetical protein
MKCIPTIAFAVMSLPKAKDKRMGSDVTLSTNGVLYLIMADKTP